MHGLRIVLKPTIEREDNNMSMKGIDVSGWQKGIDLSKIDCDFVIVKATQGTGFTSEDYERQATQAKSLGKKLGIYHYANGSGAKEEAEFFVSKVKPYLKEAILVLDWEKDQNSKFGAGIEYPLAWLNRVYELTGVRPLIYMSKSVTRQHDWTAVAKNYGLWVAQYANNNQTGYQSNPWTDKNGYGAWSSPAIFQYSSHGRLSGYNANLDINIAYMDAAAWDKYAAGEAGAKQEEKEQPNGTPTGTTLELVYGVMTKQYGDGDARKAALGSRYDEVQNTINHICSASAETLAEETKAGKYGNGSIRKAVLGDRYNEVQKIINGGGVTKQQSRSYTVKKNDNLTKIAKTYGTTVNTIVQKNKKKYPKITANFICVGWVLEV